MAAERIKKKQINTEKQELIIACKNDSPEKTMIQIASECNTSPSYVSEVLDRYGIIKVTLDDFKEHKADIFAGLQSRLLTNITAAEIQKASIQQRVVSAGILHDKEQELRGLNKSATRPLVIINKIAINTDHNNGDNTPIIDVECQNTA
jgi:hypothetical protein